MTADAPKRLNIGIVGAGIAGLTAAIALRVHGVEHNVTVFEKYAEYQTTFSGPIQLSSNSTSILTRLGVREEIEKCLPTLKTVNNAHSYKDGKLLLSVPAETLNNQFGSPIWNISRYQLGRILLDRARSVGAVVKFKTIVRDVDTRASEPSILTQDGEPQKFDLIIAADGIRSPVRRMILGEEVKPVCPLTAYSINIPRESLQEDPDLRFMLNRSGFWMGPGLSVNQMDMPDFNDSCNFCFSSETDEGTEGEWHTTCDINTVRAKFSNFEPRLRKVLDLADSKACYIWRLSDIPEIKTWLSESKRVVLLGDAVHAMLPFAGLGAACGIEDALCLAECLTQVKSLEDHLPLVLSAYEAIRKPRTNFITEMGRRNMHMGHLPDGPEQEARDASFSNFPGQKSAASNAATVSPSTKGKLGDSEDAQPRKLKDYDPPSDATHTFEGDTWKYVMAYDLLEHTRLHLKTVV